MKTANIQSAKTGSGSVLHNMSCRPNTSISHKPNADLVYGRGMVYCLPSHHGDGLAWAWLSVLDRKRYGQSAEQAEAELRRRINENTARLDLPPAAVVHDTIRDGYVECHDLLTILTVVAKSAKHVFLRDKAPNLSNLKPSRRVILIIPPERDST